MANKRCVNPFVHRFQFRTIDYIQLIIGSIILVPIRVVLTLFLFLVASMIAKFANYLLDNWKLDKEDESKWRSYLRVPCVMTFRAMFFCAGFHRMKIVDKGGPNADKEARVIVVAPHTSPFDVLSGIGLKIPAPVARHDSIDMPLFGNVIKITDPVFVQRDSQSSRNNVLSSVLEKIKFVRIFFFPEGTCTNRRALCQFKAGAFKLGLPVQPVALKYDQGDGPDTLSWTWDGPAVWKSIWLTLCRFNTSLEVTKLPVYYPSPEELKDPELYAYNVSVLLSRELDLPNLYYSYDDVKYLQHK
ncbi:unnamed protein product [Medioppia subpectinata]|uniref:Phospholipid/glycerol acyltransferase domain-containing protein n=1 Tax=Medioppia subpectinata TaxID=1979941 RepID=A0A7R9LEM4_9ACAR|nr:unnamed protein product [Medioppia subpectinata]CAG2117716.1 unnamed protein product [Medioppia subpectinata]